MALYDAESGDISLFLSGDSIINRRTSIFTEPRYLELVEHMRATDVTFTNAEMLFHDYENSPGPHQSLIGTYMRSDPANIKELQWMGINLVSSANNHAYDYGEGGVRSNLANLDAAGLVHAGSGHNLAEAREPAYLDTAAGRVALVACTDSGPAEGRAGDQRRDMLGRPGVSWLRSSAEYTVDRPTFDALRKMSEDLGFERRKKAMGFQGDNDEVFHLFGQPMYSPYPSTRFALGNGPGLRRIPDPADLAAILQRVRDARRMADWVIVTMHNHESGQSAEDPGHHLSTLAHEAIDAGADVFVGHGPHRDRGMEIYKNKPIFYALGDFFLQNDTVLRQPQDNYERHGLTWDSTPSEFYDGRSANETKGMPGQPEHWANTVVLVRFEAHKLTEVRLLPVDLGYKRSRGTRGRPVLASDEVASGILEKQARMSAVFGTDIEIDRDSAIIKL